MAAGLGAAGGVLAVEVCAPLLLLCWLCCWPGDEHSETSSTSGKPPRKPVLANESGSGRRRSGICDWSGRRGASSAASLHLPSTSGARSPWSHRSHEDLGRRRSHLEAPLPVAVAVAAVVDADGRYHSAPSVIHEVIHRRDWERSTKDLYIPLKPDIEVQRDSDESPEAPKADAESSSIECRSDEKLSVPCKKHFTNIKSSKHKNSKELTRDDDKDTDTTENIQDNDRNNTVVGQNDQNIIRNNKNTKGESFNEKVKSMYQAKENKQSVNESVKTKDKVPNELEKEDDVKTSKEDRGSKDELSRSETFKTKMFDIDLDFADELDPSGTRHYLESRTSLYPCVSTSPFPPESVEVGYRGGACVVTPASPARRPVPAAVTSSVTSRGARLRIASDGDILGSAPRPESGAFSESDVELEAIAREERPPPYHELCLPHHTQRDHKETAI